MPIIQVVQFLGWSDAVAKDDATVLDDSTFWDDNGGAESLFNYLLGATSSLMFYEGQAIFESQDFSLAKCGVVHSSKMDWVSNVPAGTSIIVQTSYYDGQSWSPWANVAKGGSISGIGSGKDMKNYKLKYRVIARSNSGSVMPGVTPTVSQVTFTFFTKKLMRIYQNSVIKTAGTITQNAIEAL